jgi:hypothetical protein
MNALKGNTIAALCVTSLLAISACGGNSPATTTTGTTTTPVVTGGIYVVENIDIFYPPSPSLVLQFSKTANGAVAPTSTITGPANLLIFSSLAVDTAGTLYVAGPLLTPTGAHSGPVNILAYSAGTTTPARTITPSSLTLLGPNNEVYGLAVDASGNLAICSQLVASGQILEGVSIFPPSASGDVPPTRVIAGSATTIFQPSQMAADSASNLYIANGQISGPASILIFNSTATGNVQPTSTLGGTSTTIYFTKGVAVDKAGNIYVSSRAQDITSPTGTTLGAPSILVFSPGATGNVAPIRTITGAATMMDFGNNLAVDGAGNIYTLSHVTGLSAILVFGPTANGNVAPTAIITPSGTQPSGVLNSTNGSSIAVQ